LCHTFQAVVAHLGEDTGLWAEDVWVAASTPVQCGRSRQTAHRSGLAGCAEYGYCASYSRWFWGLYLHLLCTPSGLPVSFALADERTVLLGILDSMPAKVRSGQVILADRNYYGQAFEQDLAAAGITLVRPTRKGEQPRPGQEFLKPMRQVIESINQTWKGQLNLEAHGARTFVGVIRSRASSRPASM